MSPFPFPSTAVAGTTPATAPTIKTRQQLETVLENIAALRREHDDLRRAQENDLAAVRQKYRAALDEVETFLDLETRWVETWARAHPEALATDRTLACTHGTLAFRAAPPSLERASRRWTWTRIAHTLAGLTWGPRYLRLPPPEVDKDLLLADLPRLDVADLRAAGIRIEQGERFHISTEIEQALQQAA
jgi:phage host-nuclease inhibitor protein Gam